MKVNSLSKLLLIMCICFIGSITAVHAQDDDDSEYTREFVWGINKNTQGGYIGGLNIKFSRNLSPGIFRTLGVEVVNIKHPREARFRSFSGGSFIFGKVNYLYSVRASYGLEKVMFKKGPQQGVQINLLASAGPSLGIIAPYYVEYADGNSNYSYTRPYTPDLNPTSIYGPGRPLEGIGKSSLTPGVHIRTGVSFEFGTFKSNVSGLELGLMAEAFTQRVKLISAGNPNWFFPSAYITLFHGNRR
jgi:hypothetical protein